jgi:hypothetical protein
MTKNTDKDEKQGNNPKRQKSEDTKSSQGGMENPSAIKNEGKQEKEVVQKSAKSKDLVKYRRLDSIAWLLQGDDTCAACCFDGEELLVAHNSRPAGQYNDKFSSGNNKREVVKESMLFAVVKNELNKIAKLSYKVSQKIKDNSAVDDLLALSKGMEVKSFQESKEEYKEEVLKKLTKISKKYVKLDRAINQSIDVIWDSLLHTELHRTSIIYNESCERALYKIMRSIRDTYLDPGNNKNLDIEVANAIKSGEIRQVASRSEDTFRNTHAELILIDELIKKGKINIKDNSNDVPSIYMGVSKRCCLTCEVAIKAVIEVKKPIDMLAKKEKTEDFISFRGEHRLAFRSACPKFLSGGGSIAKKFIELFRREIIPLIKKGEKFLIDKVELTEQNVTAKLVSAKDAFKVEQPQNVYNMFTRRQLQMPSTSTTSSTASMDEESSESISSIPPVKPKTRANSF